MTSIVETVEALAAVLIVARLYPHIETAFEVLVSWLVRRVVRRLFGGDAS